MKPDTTAQFDAAGWGADESPDDLSDIDLGDARGELLAEAPGAVGHFHNAAARHEVERKRFANAAQARDAASLLQRAMGFPAPEAISARWSRYQVRRVDYLSESPRDARRVKGSDRS